MVAMAHRIGRWCWWVSATVASAQVLAGDAGLAQAVVLEASLLRLSFSP